MGRVAELGSLGISVVIYVVTDLRYDATHSFNLYEFKGIVRADEQVHDFMKANGVKSAMTFAVRNLEVGPAKKTLYVVRNYRKAEDLFEYKGVFTDFDSATRAAESIGASVISYELPDA